MTDLLDERLTEAGRRWRAEQPAPPPVPLDMLDQRAPRWPARRPVLAAAAALVVVAGGVGGAAALEHGGSKDSGAAGHESPQVQRAPRPAVPWRDLPAGHPRYPRENGHVTTPYDHVVATGEISGRAQPGDTLTFVTVLESPTDLPLDPCPDFTIAFGRSSAHTWRLNCTQVPYRDGHGRPVLPAHTNVRFAMRVEVPDELGRQKVLWTLDGPQERPGFYGIVRVGVPQGG
jgi:hypothetical protein